MVFVVLAPGGPSPYPAEESIRKAFPNDFYKFSDGIWFVSADGTSKEIAEKLGLDITKTSPVGPMLVMPTTGYFGLAGADLWEWLNVKGSARPLKAMDGTT